MQASEGAKPVETRAGWSVWTLIRWILGFPNLVMRVVWSILKLTLMILIILALFVSVTSSETTRTWFLTVGAHAWSLATDGVAQLTDVIEANNHGWGVFGVVYHMGAVHVPWLLEISGMQRLFWSLVPSALFGLGARA